MKNKIKTFQSTHEKWRHRRKLLTPAFHFKILEDSLKVFNRQSDTCADILSIDSNFGETILDLFPYMTRCTLDIILETAMGQTLDEQVESELFELVSSSIHCLVSLHSSRTTNNNVISIFICYVFQNNKESKYAQAIQTMVHVMQQRQMIPWMMPDLLFNLSPLKKDYDTSLKILHDFTESVIKSKREEVARHEKNLTKSTGPIAFLDLVKLKR